MSSAVIMTSEPAGCFSRDGRARSGEQGCKPRPVPGASGSLSDHSRRATFETPY
jgi:hypothetical protein